MEIKNKEKYYPLGLLLISFGVGVILAKRYYAAQDAAAALTSGAGASGGESAGGGGGGFGGGGGSLASVPADSVAIITPEALATILPRRAPLVITPATSISHPSSIIRSQNYVLQNRTNTTSNTTPPPHPTDNLTTNPTNTGSGTGTGNTSTGGGSPVPSGNLGGIVGINQTPSRYGYTTQYGARIRSGRTNAGQLTGISSGTNNTPGTQAPSNPNITL